jgi:hypothetical protein
MIEFLKWFASVLMMYRGVRASYSKARQEKLFEEMRK